MDGMGWYISGCGIAIHNIKIQIRQGTMTRAHTYDTLVHFQPHIKPLMNVTANLNYNVGELKEERQEIELKRLKNVFILDQVLQEI